MMKALPVVFRLGLLIGFGIEIPGCSSSAELPTTAQTTSPNETQVATPNDRGFDLRKSTGDDARRSADLQNARKTQPPTADYRRFDLRKLTGDDARRAADLQNARTAAVRADRWDVAIARQEELLALRTRVQGP